MLSAVFMFCAQGACARFSADQTWDAVFSSSFVADNSVSVHPDVQQGYRFLVQRERRFEMMMQCFRKPRSTEVAQLLGAGDSRATMFVNATNKGKEFIAWFFVRRRYSSTRQQIESLVS